MHCIAVVLQCVSVPCAVTEGWERRSIVLGVTNFAMLPACLEGLGEGRKPHTGLGGLQRVVMLPCWWWTLRLARTCMRALV